MTVREIIADWLTSHGYDGLYNEDGDCACLVDDLGPCCEMGFSCRAGVLGKCGDGCANGGGCPWHIVERGHQDQMMDADFADSLNRDSLNRKFGNGEESEKP